MSKRELTADKAAQIDRLSEMLRAEFEKISDLELNASLDAVWVWVADDATVGVTIDWDYLERSGTYAKHASTILSRANDYLAGVPSTSQSEAFMKNLRIDEQFESFLEAFTSLEGFGEVIKLEMSHQNTSTTGGWASEVVAELNSEITFDFPVDWDALESAESFVEYAKTVAAAVTEFLAENPGIVLERARHLWTDDRRARVAADGAVLAAAFAKISDMTLFASPNAVFVFEEDGVREGRWLAWDDEAVSEESAPAIARSILELVFGVMGESRVDAAYVLSEPLIELTL